MARASSLIHKGRYMREHGNMTRHMASVPTSIQTVLSTKVAGIKTSKMVSELSNGQILLNSLVNIAKAEKMAWVGMCGPTERSTRDSGMRTR